MTQTSIELQRIVFPEQGDLQQSTQLFFRGDMSGTSPEDRLIPEDRKWDFTVKDGVRVQDNRFPKRYFGGQDEQADSANGVRYDVEEKCLKIPAGQLADLSCYLNMFSAAKWMKYTFAENIVLDLDIQGDAVIDVIAYRLDDFSTLKQVETFQNNRRNCKKDNSLKARLLASLDHSSPDRQRVSIAIGNPDATLVGFVITAKSDVRLFGGAWSASVDQQFKRTVDLCLATTTFRKEEFITHNIGLVKDMLEDDPNLAQHFKMLVIDNGQTLQADELEDEHVKVFGNVNVGGSGGFARGMIEALNLDQRPTHILIMDDDVVILAESIRRMVALLTIMRPEYQDCYISGAMLRLEAPDVQHEDIGFINEGGFYASKKGVHSLRTVIDCAANEVEWPDFKHEYAAWWYCCIPMQFVSPETLPIPFFIRGDDVEYSIRNNAQVISLNGICVWHLGFTNKFSAQMEYYQVVRNSFIVQAFHSSCDSVDFLDNCHRLITSTANEFAYDYADLILDAIEDFLEGPSIIEEPNGLEIIRKKGEKNESLVPLSEVWSGEIDFSGMFEETSGLFKYPRILQRKLTTFSNNGQLHFGFLVGNGIGFTPYDWDYYFQPIFMKDQVISVNPGDLTACVRKRDPERYAQVHQREAEVFARYRAEYPQVRKAYLDAYPKLTSIGFWKSYLGID